MPRRLDQAYEARVASGAIARDEAQAGAVRALARLAGELTPPRRLKLALPTALRSAPVPRGVYLWGPVGRGKSMLMDLFFETAPEPRKRRAHFQAFMAEIHANIDTWRKGDAAARRARFGQARGDDPIAPVADLVARDARLLCFDELQVEDIADAMILGRLFEALFARGTILVATSNRAPQDLYKDGLNRQLFLPFIDLLTSKMEVVAVAGPRDFRLDRLRASRVWFSSAEPTGPAEFDALWRDLLAGAPEAAAAIEILGRALILPRASGGLVRTRFTDLCAAALGPQDYLALAARFHTVFLEDVPRLGPERRDEARRLVSLIDALYEAKTRLVTLAEAEPASLYPAGREAFAFERTASRLEEMRATSWFDVSPAAAGG